MKLTNNPAYNNKIVKQIDYDSFGNILSDTNPNLNIPIGFAGGLYDKDTKLTKFGYREYDSNIGRWITKDPIDFNGGDFNLYGYVLNDPVNGVDVEGLETEVCHRAFTIVPDWGSTTNSYPRHCYIRFNGNSDDTLSFDPEGVHSDPAPNKPGTVCIPTNGIQNDDCVRDAMQNCQAENYSFTKFNCCHCAEQALKGCGLSIPTSSWPNWPVNPGPQPYEPGYSPVPVYGPNLGK